MVHSRAAPPRSALKPDCSIFFRSAAARKIFTPSPAHPGCIYGEMNRCLRPCQQVVSIEEYRSEASRVEQFLRTGGASLVEPAEAARDRASAAMQFEEAERMHQRVDAHSRGAGARGRPRRRDGSVERRCCGPVGGTRRRRIMVHARRKLARSAAAERCGRRRGFDGSPASRDDLGIEARWRAQSRAPVDPASLARIELERWRVDRLSFAREDSVSKTCQCDRARTQPHAPDRDRS